MTAEAFRQQLAAAGAAAPWKAAGDFVADAAGQDVLEVDPWSERDADASATLAQLVAQAVNTCAGFGAAEPGSAA